MFRHTSLGVLFIKKECLDRFCLEMSGLCNSSGTKYFILFVVVLMETYPHLRYLKRELDFDSFYPLLSCFCGCMNCDAHSCLKYLYDENVNKEL